MIYFFLKVIILHLMSGAESLSVRSFESYLYERDEAADQALDTLLTAVGNPNPQNLVTHVFQNPENFPNLLEPIVNALESVDKAKWNLGGTFYQNHKVHVSVGLSMVSLPLTFVSPEGKTLTQTGFLSGDCTDTICKRIAQTQMFVDLSMRPGDLEVNYDCQPIYAVLKLRLIHALARKKLKLTEPDKLIEPINHLDTASVLSLFHAS